MFVPVFFPSEFAKPVRALLQTQIAAPPATSERTSAEYGFAAAIVPTTSPNPVKTDSSMYNFQNVSSSARATAGPKSTTAAAKVLSVGSIDPLAFAAIEV